MIPKRPSSSESSSLIGELSSPRTRSANGGVAARVAGDIGLGSALIRKGGDYPLHEHRVLRGQHRLKTAAERVADGDRADARDARGQQLLELGGGATRV